MIKFRNKKVINILKSHGVKKAAVFGSFARGEEKKASDIDFLVELKPGRTLFDLGGLKVELEETLGRKVDLVEYSMLHPIIKEKVLKEKISFL